MLTTEEVIAEVVELTNGFEETLRRVCGDEEAFAFFVFTKDGTVMGCNRRCDLVMKELRNILNDWDKGKMVVPPPISKNTH